MKKLASLIVVASLLALPTMASASIAFDASVNQQTGSGSTLTFAFTTSGSNRYLDVSCLIQGSQTLTGITYAGVSMTQLKSISTANVSAGETSYSYGLANPAIGTNNVVVSGTGSATVACVASSYTGAQSASAVEASGAATGAGTTSSVNVTTLTDNDWLVSYCRSDGGITSGGTNTTLRGTPTALTMADSNAALSPAGSYAQSCVSSGGTQWGIISIALKPLTVVSSASALQMMYGWW